MSTLEPTEHRPPRWFVAVHAVALLLGGIGVTGELTAAEPRGSQLLLYGYGFVVLLAGAALWEMLRSTVRIDDETVLVRGLFGDRAIPLAEIDYVRLDGQGVQLRLLSGRWQKLPPPNWIRASPTARRRIAEDVEARLPSGTQAARSP